MDLKKAKKEYLNYISNYEMSIFDLKRRAEHSIRVMELSGKIAKSLNLSDEDIDLAMLIGLLHDIARYEEYIQKYILKNNAKIDHGDLGVEILKKDNYIREFIEEDKYDDIILKAIKSHNKFEIEKGLTDEELLFAKIIRDADKLDIFYECIEKFWIDIKEVEKSFISEEVFDDFRYYKLVEKGKVKTPIDNLIMVLAFIYDLNFKYSYEVLKEERYIEKIIDLFNFENNKITMKQIEEIRKISNEYIQEQ